MAERREGWEPEDGSAWLEADPVAHLPKPDGQDSEVTFRIAEELSQGLLRLPVAMRRQAWREREIFAAFRRLGFRLGRLEGRAWLGVGRRDVAGVRQLVAVFSVELTIPPDSESFRRSLDIPEFFFVPSIVAPAEEVPVPIFVEQAQSPSRYGTVSPGDWALGSSPEAVATLPPTQSGDAISGEDEYGLASDGTLTAIVSRKGDDLPLLLSAEHILGPIGRSVIADRPNKSKVAVVVDSDCRLDAAIAEPIGPFHLDYRAKAANNMVPAAYIPPTSDMPVQMWGARSNYQQGFIDQALRVPATAGRIGLLTPFSARLRSGPGDSGALILSGHGQAPALIADTQLAAGTDAGELSGAMLGMLLAGPSPKIADPTLEVWAVPLIEILERFGLQVWVRA